MEVWIDVKRFLLPASMMRGAGQAGSGDA